MKKLFKIFGLTGVFEQDPSNDPNNPNPTGGDDDPSKGGGGSDDPKNQEPPKDQTYEITVDGEKRQLTIEELKEHAQKAAGADKKFEEAAKLRKEASDGIRLKELVGRLSDGKHEPTESEVKELAGMIGADPSELTEYLAGESEGRDNGGGTGISEEEFDKVFTSKFGFSPAEAKQREEYRHSKDVEAAKKEIRKISDEAVDKDEIFGKIKIGEKGDKAEDRIAVIKDMVAEDVLRRVQNGESFGAELVAASVQKIRAYLTRFGIPGKPEQYPVALGLGPSGGLPAEVNSEEPIQRVSSADENGEPNFIARYMQKGLKSLREASRRQ